MKGPKAQSAFARSVSVAVWSVVDESMSVSPSEEGEGSRMALGADCEMFIQLGTTGMYPAGEEKCSKPIYFIFFSQIIVLPNPLRGIGLVDL